MPAHALLHFVLKGCWCAAVARVGAMVGTAVERRQEAVAPGKLSVQQPDQPSHILPFAPDWPCHAPLTAWASASYCHITSSIDISSWFC